MEKQKVLTKICDTGIVAVVRANSGDQAKKIADACIKGGIGAIEVTFTVPGAHRIIEELAAAYSPEEMIVGAGTVLDSETARIAILSGAQYVVSPYFDADTMKTCNRYAIPCMPGVMTVREIVQAMEAGADIVKLFPGEAYGPKLVKAFHGPLPQARIMPTGGVSLDNVDQWIKNGVVAVGAGSCLTGGAKTGDYDSITQTAKQFVAKIAEARASLA